MRLAYYILARVCAEISRLLLCHVVHISHVVLEAGYAPPETESMREPRGSLAIKGGSNSPVRLDCLKLDRIEIARVIELLDFGLERRHCLTKILRRGLPADGYRTCMIQRVVVDAEILPQPAVHKALLEIGAGVIQDI